MVAKRCYGKKSSAEDMPTLEMPKRIANGKKLGISVHGCLCEGIAMCVCLQSFRFLFAGEFRLLSDSC